jgi:hypothetical protein
MKLPVDTSAIAFLCALAPEPVVDFETERPRADENGEPLYVVQLIAMATTEPDMPGQQVRQGERRVVTAATPEQVIRELAASLQVQPS